MVTVVHNNPAAFPTVEELEVRRDEGGITVVETRVVHREGMTLRDYFAAKALQGLVESGQFASDEDAAFVAAAAYEFADAMLKARGK